MIRTTIAGLALLLAVAPAAVAADPPPKDTTAAAFTRTKKLKGKVTVDIKNEPLKAAFDALSEQLQDQKLGAISVHNGVGVSLNTRVTFSGKDITAEEAIDGLLKQLDLGYHVVSKEKDRYDGWLEINKGNHRGYPPGVTAPKGTDTKTPDPEPKKNPEPKVEPKKNPEPKPPASDDPDEKQARSRLDLAKEFIEMDKKEDAGRLLKYVLKNFPKTKAAEEAKELMEKIK